MSDAPKITFPCDYPVKVIGQAESVAAFEKLVLETARRYDPRLEGKHLTSKLSRNGNFFSVRVALYVTDAKHLQELFNDLKATGKVQMVL